jgi:hypothetical protein
VMLYEMKVWPFGAAHSGGGFKPPPAALAEDLVNMNAEARQGRDGGLVDAVLHERWRLVGPPESSCGRRL